ncbi:MAG: beta strand repeat-containing protein, partial [Flavobacterium sp.]
MKKNYAGLKLLWGTACVLMCLMVSDEVWGQSTVNYIMQTSNFNQLRTERNNNPPFTGTFNNGSAEIGQFANQGSFGNTPGAAAFQTFTTSGVGSGTARPLTVGDRFTITAFTSGNPSAGGRIGISFRASTAYTNFFSSTDAATVARFQLDNSGNWKVYSGNTEVATSNIGPGSDRTFSIEITSSNTFNATIGNQTFYDISFGAAGPITSFSIYTFGDNNPDSFWKNATLSNFGHASGDGLRYGYDLSSGNRTVSGTISNGFNTNATSGTLPNVVRIGGSDGTALELSGVNTYSGATFVNGSPNATLRLGNASALGTSSSVTVNSGGTLDLNGVTVSTARPLTLNGTGLSNAGALVNTSATAVNYSGNVTLASNSSIGGLGNITLLGIISGNFTLSKVGSNSLILSGTNTYTGQTNVTGGTLQLSGSGTLGNNSDIRISTGASLNLNGVNAAVRSIAEAGVNNSGTINLGSATLTINGGWSGDIFQNSISGSGSIIKNGSGLLDVFGTQSYTGTTTINGGTFRSNVDLSSSEIIVNNGGTFTQRSTANISVNSMTLNSG